MFLKNRLNTIALMSREEEFILRSKGRDDLYIEALDSLISPCKL